MATNRKSIAICGTKTTTPPTPASTPSTTSERIAPSGKSPLTSPLRKSMPAEMPSMSGVASQKIDENIASIVVANTSVPQSRWVSASSIRSPSGLVDGGCRCTTPESSCSIQA